MKINWEKLNAAIQELEKKHREEKRLKPEYDRWNTRYYQWRGPWYRPEPLSKGPKPEKPEEIRDINWCKFYRETFELTRLYVLKAHLRGRRHMTRISVKWLPEFSYAGLKSLHAKLLRRMYKNSSKYIIDLISEDELELIQDLLSVYVEPEPTVTL